MNTVYKTLKGIEGFTKNYKRISHIKTALTAVLIIYTVIKFAATGVEIYKALKHLKLVFCPTFGKSVILRPKNSEKVANTPSNSRKKCHFYSEKHCTNAFSVVYCKCYGRCNCMLHRKIEKKISDWIKNSKKALLIDGARQVGKTYIIKKILENEGCEYIEFNLLENQALCGLLAKSETVDDMIANLSLFADKPFKKGKTFIFFDEIQEFKELTTKIKFWVDEGSFRYIFSGSLLGVELKNIKSAPVGYLKTYTMFPMDFEEFLQIYNFSEDLRSSLYRSFIERKPVNDTVHQRMMQIFNMYLNVGGMPAAVQKFRETRNLEDVISEHDDIVVQYKKDFTHYEIEDKKPYLTQIYDLIPAELNSNNKRFNFADLKKGLHYTRSEDNFLWLAAAGVALPVYNITEPVIPLLLNEKSSLFKLFLSDIGMLTTLYGRATKLQLLSDNRDINNGALYENAVAQELRAHGFKLYYYNSKKFGELDFVIEYKGKVLPIEVKSGKSYQRHSALNNIMEISNYSIEEAFIFSDFNVEVKGNLVYYPIYMLMFLTNEDAVLPETVALDDLSSIPTEE